MVFPGGIKNLPANAGDARDVGLIPESGIFPGIEKSIHSSILAWIIPWTEEPGLPPIGSVRVGHTEDTHRQQTLKTQYDQN